MQINQIDNRHHLKYWTGHVVITHAHRSFLTVVRHLNAICPPRVLYNTCTLTIALTIFMVCWEISSWIGTPTDFWLMMLSSMMSLSKFHLDYMFCWLVIVIPSFWRNPCKNPCTLLLFSTGLGPGLFKLNASLLYSSYIQFWGLVGIIVLMEYQLCPRLTCLPNSLRL